MQLQRFSTLLLFCFFFLELSAQTDSLYKLESRLISGDKRALYDIAPFFDSKKKVVEFLGYHRLEQIESSIAKRIVNENTLFTKKEFTINNSTSADEFIRFVHSKYDQIAFSSLADIFLITPIESRNAEVQARKISDRKLQKLRTTAKNISELQWVTRQRIDSLIMEKNPLILLKIASEYFKERNRYNRYNFNEKDFINLFQLLTGMELGVMNNRPLA